MIFYLLYPLRKVHVIFNVLGYVTFRAALVFTISLLFTMFLGPLFIKLARTLSFKEHISEDVPERHKKKEGIPTMGGLLIISGILLGLLLGAEFLNRSVLVSMFVILGFGIVGLFDDILKSRKGKGFSIPIKFGLLFIITAIVGLYIVFYPFNKQLATSTNLLFFKNVVINLGIFYIPFVMFVTVGSANAVNFADGLDGLAAGLSAIMFGAFAVLAYIVGHYFLSEYLNVIFIPKVWELTVVCSGMVGALLGFLWYNSHPASIFMGDTGSLPLGGLAGAVAVMLKQEILLGIIGGVFVVEVLSVILQIIGFKYFKGKRILKMAPIHHHFELKGLEESKVVIRFWIAGILLALMGLATLKIR